MEWISRPRQSGKTIELIKRAAKDGLYIVCISHDEAYRVSQVADSMGLHIPFPLTLDEYLEGRFHHGGVKGFVIDNIEHLIQRTARGLPVEAVSYSLPQPPIGE